MKILARKSGAIGAAVSLFACGGLHGATFNIPSGDVAGLKGALNSANANRE